MTAFTKLYMQVCMHTCADLIDSVPFFDEAEEGFITSLVTLLRPEVYLKDDMIIREGRLLEKCTLSRAAPCRHAQADATPGMTPKLHAHDPSGFTSKVGPTESCCWHDRAMLLQLCQCMQPYPVLHTDASR